MGFSSPTGQSSGVPRPMEVGQHVQQSRRGSCCACWGPTGRIPNRLCFRDTSGQGRFCTIFRSYSRGAQVRPAVLPGLFSRGAALLTCAVLSDTTCRVLSKEVFRLNISLPTRSPNKDAPEWRGLSLQRVPGPHELLWPLLPRAAAGGVWEPCTVERSPITWFTGVTSPCAE